MIRIKRAVAEKIILHAKKEYPNEACGILAGNGDLVSKAHLMKNVDNSPQSFFMDAKEQLKVFKGLREKGLQMLGIYHSHVASQAYPSSRDVELAFYPEASYVIISLPSIKGAEWGQGALRSFKIVENKIQEEELKIIE